MVRFAPMNTPFQRRLQTVAVLVALPLQFYCMGISVALFLFPLTLPLMLLYLVWIHRFDKSPMNGKRKWPLIRRLSIWRWVAEYFPITIIKTADLDPTKHYLFGSHPHGILSTGALVAFGTEACGFSKLFPGIDVHLLGLAAVTKTPFSREVLLWLGLGNVSRRACEYHLKHPNPGRSIAIVIGGAQEALEAEPDTLTLTIANRKGFVRVALQTGASLVPVLSFGENELYEQLHHPVLRRIQDFLQERLGFSFPLINGRGVFQYSFGLLPRRVPIHVVFGRPIPCPQVDEPTQEQVDECHAKYLEELRHIYDDHKSTFMPLRKSTLVFANAVVHNKNA